MKKRLLISACLVAALMLASCSKETTVTSSEEKPQVSASVDTTENEVSVSKGDIETEPEDDFSNAYTVEQGDAPIGEYAYAETLTTRGLVAFRTDGGTFISWRRLGDEESTVYTLKCGSKTIYEGTKTCFFYEGIRVAKTYSLTVNGVTEETESNHEDYIELSLVAPDKQQMPNIYSYAKYTANDMSVGDLDGDGELELIVKWYPDNAQDNSKDGYTGTTFLDAYDIDYKMMSASLMWRIDLGINIRSGAHYTQFQVWDYDGDGKAEVLCKTADGTTTYDADLNETGFVGAVSMASLSASKKGKPETYDFRQHSGRIGRIVLGTEYLTAFDGATGKIIDSTEYIPARGPFDEEKGIYITSDWEMSDGKGAEKNDGYANRADRFLAGTGYLDDGSACAIFCRGYYGRACITAWKLIDGKLSMKWAFDASAEGPLASQGNHQLSINDVDGDGYDEIVYGALCVDNDGSVLYSTGLGHGDAMHVCDWNNDGKLEVFSVHEHTDAEYSVELHDAATGEILWGEGLGTDVGRGLAADVDPTSEGAEFWSAGREGVYDINGKMLYKERPSINFSLYWDGDLQAELFDSNNSTDLIPQIQKWDYENHKLDVYVEATGCQCNNGTKANACLVADILGDWREEVIVRDAENPSIIRIYTTNFDTDYSFDCLLLNRTYREGIAWQNTGYNQPVHINLP